MFDPIQTSPTMAWTNPAMNFKVPKSLMEEPLSGLGVVSVPELAGAAGGAAIIGSAMGMALRGLAGYFAGKWSGSSKGWAAASAAILGVPGLAGSIYFTRKNKAQPNRRRRSKKARRNSKLCLNGCGSK